MAIRRTRKEKETPHYNFSISWQPKEQFQARVKREHASEEKIETEKFRHGEKAVSLAQEASGTKLKKGIIKSLILISFILILELVIYLAWNKFILS